MKRAFISASGSGEIVSKLTATIADLDELTFDIVKLGVQCEAYLGCADTHELALVILGASKFSNDVSK
jgi:hypothetical protein